MRVLRDGIIFLFRFCVCLTRRLSIDIDGTECVCKNAKVDIKVFRFNLHVLISIRL